MARNRTPGRDEWPVGLYKKKLRGVERFYFRNEQGEEKYFPPGTTFIDAYTAADTYNKQYRSPITILASKADKYNRPLHEWSKVIVDRYVTEEQPSKNSVDTFKNNVKRLNALFGDTLSKSFTISHATDYLNHYCVEPKKSLNVYNRNLSFLNKFFNYLIDEQGVEVHPSINKKFKVIKEKKKCRLDLDPQGYKQIFEAAPDWLKVAMAICLQSTHAVKELHRLKYKIDKPKVGECGCVWFKEAKHEQCSQTQQLITIHGTMYIHRHKTQDKKSSFVAIPITDELKSAIDFSMQDGLNCPYIVRRKPEKNNKISIECDHRFQVTSNMISRAFSEVRDEIGIYSELPKHKRPTFHEIRRLSAKTLNNKGINPKERMAHANQESTEIYTDSRNIEWIKVAPSSVEL